MERGSVLADVRVVSTIHAGPALPTTFDAFRIVEEYRRPSEEHGVAIPDALADPAHAHAERIEAAFARAPAPRAPVTTTCSRTTSERPDGFWLVDYEYSGDGRPVLRPGQLSINNGLSEASQERLLRLMFGEPTDAHRAGLQLMRIMSDYREAMWGVIQQGLSTLDIDYVAYADRHFDRLSRSMATETVRGMARAGRRAV